MQTPVNLQNPFEYSLLLTLALAAAVILPIAIFLFFILRGFKFPTYVRKQKPKVVKPYKTDLPSLKRKYIQKINELQELCKKENLEDREAYLRLSSLVRTFAHHATGVHVQNFSLFEIKALNIPSLHGLIEEFYKPEFAYEAESHIEKAFEDARTVVLTWN